MLAQTHKRPIACLQGIIWSTLERYSSLFFLIKDLVMLHVYRYAKCQKFLIRNILTDSLSSSMMILASETQRPLSKPGASKHITGDTNHHKNAKSTTEQ
jgi:hypothetical protein